jgi:ATP synthase protein I
MPNADSHENDAGSSYARFFGLGFAFFTILGVLTAGGFFLDKLLGTLPLFLLIGLGLGFAGGLYQVYRALKKLGDG